MSGLIDPRTGAPMAGPRKLTDEEIITAFQALQIKIDSLMTQVFNASLLIEYMIDRNNTTGFVPNVVSDGVDAVYPLAIDAQELNAFAQKRVEEFREQMIQQLPGVDEPGAIE
jgi:hypothetical protein